LSLAYTGRSARKFRRRRALAPVIALALFALPACVASTIVGRRFSLGSDSGRVVTDAAKAQLVDGSIVTFPNGFRIEQRRVVGAGWRYDATLRDSLQVSTIDADSVAGIVAFRTAYDPAKSVGMTAAAGVIAFFGLLLAAVAACAVTSCMR
jgi:hypothetical protein